MFLDVGDERSRKNKKTALGCGNIREIRHSGVTSGRREKGKHEEESTKGRGGRGGGGNDGTYPQTAVVTMKAFESSVQGPILCIHLVKTMVFPVVMYRCESWTIKKAEH